jgi:hypothetical protein
MMLDVPWREKDFDEDARLDVCVLVRVVRSDTQAMRRFQRGIRRALSFGGEPKSHGNRVDIAIERWISDGHFRRHTVQIAHIMYKVKPLGVTVG